MALGDKEQNRDGNQITIFQPPNKRRLQDVHIGVSPEDEKGFI